MKIRWVAVAFALAAFAADAAAPTAAPPLDLLLTPHETDGRVDYVDVRMTIGHPDVGAGATLVHLPLVVASIPTQRYDGDAMRAEDSAGELPLAAKEEPATPFLHYRDWQVTRATKGDVVLRYRARPRAVDSRTRNGPLFDLREEAGGLDGAGFTFIAPPVAKGPFAIHLHWDLSRMPRGSRGIWSLGEGDVDVVRPAESLAETFYYAGPVHSAPAQGSGKFVMYWLSPPPFDARKAAAMIGALFDYASKFFHDNGSPYRVFVRRSPTGGGGTALQRSFLFGYATGKTPTLDELEGLIAHEMVHNWPSMDGDHADTSWYSEGTAEYYSILLSYRAGLITPAQFLKRINDRADGYYTNPLQNLSNRAAEQIYWKDSRAGHVPYGRGWLYLARVDAQIRAATKGKHSLDDVVLGLLAHAREGKPVTVDDWQDQVAALIGPRARLDYADMVAGRRLVPPANSFGPCFHPVAVREHLEDLGFDPIAFMATPRMISGLEPGSAAARAGLRDGDRVVEAPDVGDPSFHYDRKLKIVVERNGERVTFSFLPQGRQVTGYRWVRDRKIADSRCRI